MPVNMLNMVVFPAPFGPMRPMISPSFTWKFTESTAFNPPNCIVRPRTSSRATTVTSRGRIGPRRGGQPGFRLAPGEPHFQPALLRARAQQAVGPQNHGDDEQGTVNDEAVLGNGR